MRRYGVLAVLASGLLLAGAAGATGSWTLRSPLPVGRESPAVVTAGDGAVYAIGGTTNSSPYNTAEVDRYTPGADSWATVAPLPAVRTEAGAALGEGGRIYVAGGFQIGVGYVSEVDRYTPATDRWRAVAPLPTERILLAAASDSSGRIYAIGGYNGSQMSVVERYDPATDAWSTLPPLPTARYGLAATAGLNGWIYAIGGCSSSVTGIALNTVEAYDPVANVWHRRHSMETKRCELSAATGSDGQIYAWSGVNRSGNDDTAEVYDPATNTWAAAPPTSVPHVQGGGAASGGAIYAVAGQFRSDAAVVESLALPGALALSTESGPPGTTVRVKGTGFVAGETISITFDDSPLATAKASYRGWLSKNITVPAGATAGPHTITATGGTSGFTSQATFTVT